MKTFCELFVLVLILMDYVTSGEKCDWNVTEAGWLTCSGLSYRSTGYVKTLLAQSLPRHANISVQLKFTDVSDLSYDLFEGVNVVQFFCSDCTIPEFPFNLMFSFGNHTTFINIINSNIQVISNFKVDLLSFRNALEHLNIEFCSISNVKPYAFSNYSNLKMLGISSCKDQIPLIEDYAFARVQKLQSLHVFRCHLHSIPLNTFANLPSLDELLLFENSLSTLQNGTLNGLKTVRHLWLNANPWKCNCELQWLKDYIEKQRNVKADYKPYCAKPRYAHFEDLDFCTNSAIPNLWLSNALKNYISLMIMYYGFTQINLRT